jgi:hypothetical protein
MPPDAGQSLPHQGASSSLSGGALAGAAWDLAAYRAVRLPGGQHQAAKLEMGAGARVLRHGCQRHCAGRNTPVSSTPGGMDQDLRRSEAWLGNRWHLAGMIRAVVAGPLPQAHCCGCGWGGILLDRGVVPGGAWYNNRLGGLVVCTCGR